MITRRNVARSALWAAPAILATAPIPAYAASVTTPQPPTSFPTVASLSAFSSSDINYYTGSRAHPGCLPTSNGQPSVCPAGTDITSLGVSPAGTLIPAYGDWQWNVDSFSSVSRVYLSAYTPDGARVGQLEPAGTEALSPIRTHRGRVYTATLDPSDRSPRGAGAYSSNGRGSWDFHPCPEARQQVHIFDTDFSRDEPVFLGQDSDIQATLYVGDTKVYTHPSRMFQVARDDNSVYSLDGEGRVYRTDLTTLKTEAWYVSRSTVGLIQGPTPYIVTPYMVLKATTRQRIPLLTSGVDSVRAIVSSPDNEVLALTHAGLLYKVEDLRKSIIAHFPSLPADASSFAWLDSTLYVGDRGGNIHRLEPALS